MFSKSRPIHYVVVWPRVDLTQVYFHIFYKSPSSSFNNCTNQFPSLSPCLDCGREKKPQLLLRQSNPVLLFLASGIPCFLFKWTSISSGTEIDWLAIQQYFLSVLFELPFELIWTTKLQFWPFYSLYTRKWEKGSVVCQQCIFLFFLVRSHNTSTNTYWATKSFLELNVNSTRSFLG